MTPAERPSSSITPRQRIIFALDVSDLDEARKFVRLLKNRTGFFKVGLELFTAFGKEAVRAVQEEGGRIFLDLKLHDIPNTVSRAAEEAVKLGVDMLNVHASGGMEMMRETADRCRKLAEKLSRPKPILIAVTILTSLDEKNLQDVGILGPVTQRVVALAELAKQAGIDGVVASPQEIIPLRRKCGSQFVIVTPGIRPAFVEPGKDDQKRVLTAKEAVAAGADYIVIGRPVRLAPDPAAAMDKVIEEIA